MSECSCQMPTDVRNISAGMNEQFLNHKINPFFKILKNSMSNGGEGKGSRQKNITHYFYFILILLSSINICIYCHWSMSIKRWAKRLILLLCFFLSCLREWDICSLEKKKWMNSKLKNKFLSVMNYYYLAILTKSKIVWGSELFADCNWKKNLS